MKVVKNWKNLWKSLTVQVSAIGLVLTQVLYTIPSWEALPTEVRDAIPPEYVPYISSFFFLAAILARVKYQPTLHKDLDKEE